MSTTVPAAHDVTDERAALAAQLAAARQLYMTFDPDSPPWAAEGELERLEQVWRELTGEPFVDDERR